MINHIPGPGHDHHDPNPHWSSGKYCPTHNGEWWPSYKIHHLLLKIEDIFTIKPCSD